MRSIRALLGAFAAMAAGYELMDNPSPANFVRRAFTSGKYPLGNPPGWERECADTSPLAVTIIGDWVYIDGGEMAQMVDGPGGGVDNDEVKIPLKESHTMSKSRAGPCAQDHPF